MKIMKQFAIFSVCSILAIACGNSAIDEGTPIEDPSADAEAQTLPVEEQNPRDDTLAKGASNHNTTNQQSTLLF